MMTHHNHEAATIAAMHEQAAPPDLEYTPIADRLPELVRASDLAALEAALEQAAAAEEQRAAEVASLRARVTELEAENTDLRLILRTIDDYAPRADRTCDEPGITLGEATRRMLALQGKIAHQWHKAPTP